MVNVLSNRISPPHQLLTSPLHSVPCHTADHGSADGVCTVTKMPKRDRLQSITLTVLFLIFLTTVLKMSFSHEEQTVPYTAAKRWELFILLSVLDHQMLLQSCVSVIRWSNTSNAANGEAGGRNQYLQKVYGWLLQISGTKMGHFW